MKQNNINNSMLKSDFRFKFSNQMSTLKIFIENKLYLLILLEHLIINNILIQIMITNKIKIKMDNKLKNNKIYNKNQNKIINNNINKYK